MKIGSEFPVSQTSQSRVRQVSIWLFQFIAKLYPSCKRSYLILYADMQEIFHSQ
jgi:hypothetical protein